MKALPLALILLTGCAVTTTRTDPDAFALEASAPDASASRDAFFRDDSRDAYIGVDANFPDAFIVPTEVCNGTDDDFDTTVDETAELGCRTAAHAEAATCEAGRCQCRPVGTPLAPGLYADCNADFADGCEVPLGTDENCGACGDACDPASQCRFLEGSGFACGPADIADFTLARDDGVIACILRWYAESGDIRVVCRGPNTAHALSDTEPEDAVLGWTFVDLPVDPINVSLRASRQTRPDGRDAMTVCVGGGNGIFCRGDDSTGLLLQPGEDARGVHQVVPGDKYFYLREWSVWHGQGVARGIDMDRFEAAILVWGGGEAPHTTRRISLGGENGYFTTGDQVLFYRESEPRGLFSWGPQRGFIGGTGWVDAPGETLPLVPARDVAYPSCARDVCCAIREGRVACWGHRPSAPDEFAMLPLCRVTRADWSPSLSVAATCPCASSCASTAWHRFTARMRRRLSRATPFPSRPSFRITGIATNGKRHALPTAPTGGNAGAPTMAGATSSAFVFLNSALILVVPHPTPNVPEGDPHAT